MSEAEIDARMEALERRSRASRTALFAIVGSVAALAAIDVAFPQQGDTAIRGTRFELLDSAGEVVGVMGTDLGRYPFIQVSRSGDRGEGGAIRLEVPRSRGPACSLLDNESTERARLHLGFRVDKSEDEDPVRFIGGQVAHLVLSDADDKMRTLLGESGDGSWKLEILDAAGKRAARIPE